MKMQWMCAFILVAIGLSFWLACGDDDDDDNDNDDQVDDDADDAVDDDDDDMSDGADDDDEMDPACIDNTAPQILGVNYYVNGEAATAPLDILTTDILELEFEYADAECNLDGGGAQLFFVNEMASPNSYWKFKNMGCSSEEANPFRFFVSTLYFVLPEIVPVFLAIYDYCDADSGLTPLEIKAHYVEPDCSDPNPPELLGLQVRINGEPTALPAVAYDNDEIIVSVEYADPNCSLRYGTVGLNNSRGENIVAGDLVGIGCSSEEDGPFDIEIRCGLLGESYHPPFTLDLTGYCGRSNSLPFDLRCEYLNK